MKSFFRLILSATVLFTVCLPVSAVEFDHNDKILVIGATGRTGSLIVADLHKRGLSTVAMVRDIARGKNVLGKDVKLIKGDLTDTASLLVATKGVKGIINAASGSRKQANFKEVDYLGTVNLINAAKKNNVEKIVLLSSLGVTDKNHFLNKFANNVLIWKLEGEEALRKSGLSYSVIRPGGLIDESGGEKAIQFGQGDKITGDIPRADVATICIEALLNRQATGKTIDIISGDEAFIDAVDYQSIFHSLKKD